MVHFWLFVRCEALDILELGVLTIECWARDGTLCLGCWLRRGGALAASLCGFAASVVRRYSCDGRCGGESPPLRARNSPERLARRLCGNHDCCRSERAIERGGELNVTGGGDFLCSVTPHSVLDADHGGRPSAHVEIVRPEPRARSIV